MSGKVLLQDLIVGVSKRANISEQEAESFVQTVFAIVSDMLADEKIIKIRNLGTFKLVEVDNRETKDPATGAITRVKGYKKLVFTPDNALKDLINKPFAQFETIVLNDATDTADMEKGTENAETDDEYSQEEEDSVSMIADTGATEAAELSENDNLDSTEVAMTDEGHSENAPADSESESVPTKQDVLDFSSEQAAVDTLEVEHNSGKQQNNSESSQDAEPVNQQEESVSDMQNRAIEGTSPIQYQHADYQKVNEQKVEELNVTTQTVEHQTIEHQSIVHHEPTRNEAHEKGLRLTLSGIISLFVFMLLMMTGSYLLGYYQILCVRNHTVKTTATETVVRSGKEKLQTTPAKTKVVTAVQGKKDLQNEKQQVSSKEQQSVDSVKSQIQKEDSMELLRKKANSYPQVANGDYLIVGVKGVHRLKSGEGLLRLARKNYGSQKFITYIIKLNDFDNPDLIPVGAEIKLPQLVKK